MFDNNTSGQFGISEIADQVNGKKYLYWRVQWSDDSGKRKCKNFPRTGEGMARAIEFRDHVYGSIKSDDSTVERIAATTAVEEALSGSGLDLSLDLSRSIMAAPAPPSHPQESACLRVMGRLASYCSAALPGSRSGIIA